MRQWRGRQWELSVGLQIPHMFHSSRSPCAGSCHRTGETLTRLVCRNWSTLPFIFVKFADEQNRIRNCRLKKIFFSSGRHLLQVMKAVWLLRLHGCHRFGNPYRSLVPRILSMEPITVVNFFVCKKIITLKERVRNTWLPPKDLFVKNSLWWRDPFCLQSQRLHKCFPGLKSAKDGKMLLWVSIMGPNSDY